MKRRGTRELLAKGTKRLNPRDRTREESETVQWDRSCNPSPIEIAPRDSPLVRLDLVNGPLHGPI